MGSGRIWTIVLSTLVAAVGLIGVSEARTFTNKCNKPAFDLSRLQEGDSVLYYSHNRYGKNHYPKRSRCRHNFKVSYSHILTKKETVILFSSKESLHEKLWPTTAAANCNAGLFHHGWSLHQLYEQAQLTKYVSQLSSNCTCQFWLASDGSGQCKNLTL